MVKNTTGGGNAKKQARKLTLNRGSTELRKSESPNEVYACIKQNYGTRFDVVTQKDGITLSCRLPGKFKGRNKRNNIVGVGSWVLVGLYDWEKDPKNCDLLYVYEKNEIDELRNLPGVDWKYLNMASNSNLDDDEEVANSTIIFTELANNKTVEELYDNSSTNGEGVVSSGIQYDEEINIDDL